MIASKTTIGWDTLKAYAMSRPVKEYRGISPSSLGSCLRAHYWKIKGVPPTTPPGPGAQVNFMVGRHWEAELAKAFESQGRLIHWFQDEQDAAWVDPHTALVGTPDLLVYLPSGEQAVLDSKTVMSAWFKYAQSMPWEKWLTENQTYIYQQVCYVHLARLNGYPDLNKAVLSFASKDNGFIGLEVEITVTHDLLEDVLSRAKTLQGYLDSNQLPPCECVGWQVNYCSWGVVESIAPNKKGKRVPTLCCQEEPHE